MSQLLEDMRGETLPDFVERTQCLFIHVPKAAGSSVAMELYGRQIGHHPVLEWKEKFPYSFKQLYTFSIVREPIDRFISAFNFLKKGGMSAADRIFSEEVLCDFSTAAELAEALIDPQTQKQVLGYYHFIPQFDYLRNKKWVLEVDEIIPLEELSRGLAIVGVRIGIKLNEGRINSAKQIARIELSAKGLEVLRYIYRDDIEIHRNALADYRAKTVEKCDD
jgi:hypothetical protein